jgi:hypothetical protein
LFITDYHSTPLAKAQRQQAITTHRANSGSAAITFAAADASHQNIRCIAPEYFPGDWKVEEVRGFERVEGLRV